MRFDQVADDRQSDADAAVHACCRSVGLTKPLENHRECVGLDPSPAVDNLDTHHARLHRHDNLHLPADIAELHRVRQQVPEHLTQARRVDVHDEGIVRRPDRQIDSFEVDGRPDRVNRCVKDRQQIGWLHVEGQRAVDDA